MVVLGVPVVASGAAVSDWKAKDRVPSDVLVEVPLVVLEQVGALVDVVVLLVLEVR